MQTQITASLSGLAVGHSGPVHVALHFTAPSQTGAARTPAAFVAVLDRSGSMEGSPLEAARQATLTALAAMRAGDWFGLATFEDEVQTVIPCGPVGSREVAESRIRGIVSGGCTDLAAGWVRGRDLLRQAPAGMPRRLILLTDGLANRGVVEPQAIQRLCSDALEADRVRTAALGFGDDYDEDLLKTIAAAGHGELHDATKPGSLPEIFSKELGALQCIVVESLRVRVRLHPCTRSVRRVGASLPDRLPDGRLEFPIGDLVADEDKRCILEFDMDLAGQSAGGQVVLGEIEVVYEQVNGTQRIPQTHHRRIELPVLASEQLVHVNEEVRPWVALVAAGELVERALRLCDGSESQRALRELDHRIAALRAMPTSPVMNDAIALLVTGRERLADRGNYVRNRKAMRVYSHHIVAASSKDATVFESTAEPSFKKRRPRQ